MNRLKQFWIELRSGLWFVPTAMVLAAIALALILIEINAVVDTAWLDAFPQLFGAGADGSRGMLTAIASSMITVAGLTFSLTIVAMTQASSQYTSRILRNFMRDRRNQFVLGYFVGIFAYCLIVLRTIRGGDEGRFIPSLAVFFGLLFAIASIGVLIFYIHHIANSIQAATIIERVAEDTIAAVKKLFPKPLGEEAQESKENQLAAETKKMNWQSVLSPKTGYIQSMDTGKMLRLAVKRNCVLRMEKGIGEFIVTGLPLASYAGNGNLDDAIKQEITNLYAFSAHRTIEQDSAFGIQKLVDIALKALSPGINDTTTAVVCIDYLSAILSELAGRGIESPFRAENGKLRVIARGATFASLADEAFNQIRDTAHSNAVIYLRLLDAVETIACQTTDEKRRSVLARHIDLIAEDAARTVESHYNLDRIRQRILEISLETQFAAHTQNASVSGKQLTNKGERQ